MSGVIPVLSPFAFFYLHNVFVFLSKLRTRISANTSMFSLYEVLHICATGMINLLKPNDIYIYICRTAELTSRRYILNIYSTNIHIEYFKHAALSPFFSLQNAVYFIMLACLIPVLFAFYLQVC